MTIITLANQKGGVAKTTTAINLVAGLAQADQRALLIDCDPQANATWTLTGKIDFDSTTRHLLIDDGVSLADVTIASNVGGVELVPSEINLAGSELDLQRAVGGQMALRGKLADHGFDVVVIDSPPSLGMLTINALAAADKVIVPVAAGVYGLRGVGLLLDSINNVKSKLGRDDLEIGGILCTMHDHTNVAKDVYRALVDKFGGAVFNTVIPKNVALEEAHSRHQSIFDYAPSSAGADAYKNLVQEVLNRG